jgi:hypothetical protein
VTPRPVTQAIRAAYTVRHPLPAAENKAIGAAPYPPGNTPPQSQQPQSPWRVRVRDRRRHHRADHAGRAALVGTGAALPRYRRDLHHCRTPHPAGRATTPGASRHWSTPTAVDSSASSTRPAPFCCLATCGAAASRSAAADRRAVASQPGIPHSASRAHQACRGLSSVSRRRPLLASGNSTRGARPAWATARGTSSRTLGSLQQARGIRQ